MCTNYGTKPLRPVRSLTRGLAVDLTVLPHPPYSSPSPLTLNFTLHKTPLLPFIPKDLLYHLIRQSGSKLFARVLVVCSGFQISPKRKPGGSWMRQKKSALTHAMNGTMSLRYATRAGLKPVVRLRAFFASSCACVRRKLLLGTLSWHLIFARGRN